MEVWRCQLPEITFDDELSDRAEELWDDFGPNLRIAGTFLWKETDGEYIRTYVSDLKSYLETLDSKTLTQILTKPHLSSAISHRLVRSYAETPSSTTMKHRIHSQRSLEERQMFFRLFHLAPALAPSLGQLFEIMAIERLAGDFTRTLKLLEKDESQKLASRRLEAPQLLVHYFDNKIDCSATVKGGSNNSAWDAFFFIDKIAYGCQFTINKRHRLKRDGLLELQRRCREAKVETVILIIVTPKDITYTLPADLDPPRERPLFSFYQLEVDLGPRLQDTFLSLFNSEPNEDTL
ncbi:hypothetical protein GYMLUDRAFT_73470 [Collybiopsis luxurians FD-317 M1]|uniref:Uncharacterized protein n=1 Tax=Collybiopsis luxurians FD-317 M1 TaxID=944289 RepID=A0A0D0CEQ5_9AGAR|nr:hypothetical protein GYMLUDRAFT_73470 [Collybiopsis luxurians FD-317 M1]